jgi:hypothetical protein
MATNDKQNKLARYQALLAKMQSIDLGGGGFWKPPVGKSTVRILPPVGQMGDAFFVQTGTHYFSKSKVYQCPALSEAGPCPICETNEGLYQSGKKKAAAQFRASKQFMANVIVRAAQKGQEDSDPVVWQFGSTVMGQLIALIADPDYGDISDAETGTDIIVTRTGEDKNTKYQITAKRQSSVLTMDTEKFESWLSGAKDLVDLVKGKLMEYEQLAAESGVSVYLTDGEIPDISDEEEETEPETESVAEDESEQVEEEAPKPAVRTTPASAAIQAKLKARLASAK